jgi:hypothetical protein
VREVKVGAHCEREACRPALPGELGPSYLRVSDHCPIRVSFR